MQELKLNIYNKKKIVKTYTTNDVNITTGIVEKIFKLVDIDKLLNISTSQDDLGKMILKVVIKGFSDFKVVILDSFEGMTEEEFWNTHFDEVAKVIMYILTNAISSLNGIGTNEKIDYGGWRRTSPAVISII